MMRACFAYGNLKKGEIMDWGQILLTAVASAVFTGVLAFLFQRMRGEKDT